MMAANAQELARRRAGKRLLELIAEYELTTKQIIKNTGLDRVTVRNLKKFTPHLRTIEKLSIYLERVGRELLQERKKDIT